MASSTMLIRERWVTWKNVSHQSLFPSLWQCTFPSWCLQNINFNSRQQEALSEQISASPKKKKKKKKDTVQMLYNTLIENLFPLWLASMRQGTISHFSQDWQKFNPFISLSYSPASLEGSGNLGCEAKGKDGSWSQAAKQCHLGVRDSVSCILSLEWPDPQLMEDKIHHGSSPRSGFPAL